jgi:hypothetical protein
MGEQMQPRGDGWDAVSRVEDKLTDFITEARDVLREQQKFVSELATRQAVVEERLRRAESDVSLATRDTHSLHRRIDVVERAEAEQVGLRKGVVAGITLASATGGGTLAAVAIKLLGG